MHNNNTYKSNNNAKNSNKLPPSSSSIATSGDTTTITRMHPSMKRPRAPIACYRCHHKKVALSSPYTISHSLNNHFLNRSAVMVYIQIALVVSLQVFYAPTQAPVDLATHNLPT